MRYLEGIDALDRTDGTPHKKRLRQIPGETGRFIALLAACVPRGQYVEIGTSAGCSTLWLALACRSLGRSLVTFEIDEHKVTLAKQTFREAGVEDVVRVIHGDARVYLPQYPCILQIFFCPPGSRNLSCNVTYPNTMRRFTLFCTVQVNL